MNQIYNFAQQHTVAAMAAVHLAHLAWPRLVAIFPYCRDNGGAVGILKEFLRGKPVPADPPPHNPT